MNAPTGNAATRDQLIFHLLLNSAKLELWINQAGDGIELEDPTDSGNTLLNLALDLAGIPIAHDYNTVPFDVGDEDGGHLQHPDYDYAKLVSRDGYIDEFGELIRKEAKLETAITKFMASIQEPHEDSSLPPDPPSSPFEVFVKGSGYMAVHQVHGQEPVEQDTLK